MPKDILPELRLADVAELAPIANVQPETFSLNFARGGEQDDVFLDVPNQPDAEAQVNVSAAQGNGTAQFTDGAFEQLNGAQMEKMAQMPFHTLHTDNSFSPANGENPVTDGTSFATSTLQNTFSDSISLDNGGNVIGTPQTNVFQCSLASQISPQLSPADSMCGNRKLDVQGAVGSQLTHISTNQYQGQEAHPISPQMSTGSQQQIDANSHQQLQLNNQHIGMTSQDHATQKETVVNTQQHMISQQQMETNVQQHTSMNTQRQMDVRHEQLMNVNTQQQIEANIQQHLSMNPQQQMNVNTQQQMNVNTQQQMNVNTQQQMNVNTQQQIEANIQQQLSMSRQQQMNVNTQQQMNVNPQQQMDVNPQQQMNVNTQQQIETNIQQQLSMSPQQQMDVNPQQQMDVNPQQQMNVNPQQQMNVNPQQQMNVNPQQQMNVNPQQQMNVNPQQQMNVNPQQPMNVNTQQPMNVNTQQQMNVNTQHQIEANIQQQLSMSPQQQMNVTTGQQMGMSNQQQMNANTQQQMGMSNQQQMNANTQQQMSVSTQQPTGIGMTLQQQVEVNSQHHLNAEQMTMNAQHQLGMITQQQIEDKIQHQMNVIPPQHMTSNGHQISRNLNTSAQVVGNNQQQTEVQTINSPQQLCGSSHQIGMETQPGDMNTQQQIGMVVQQQVTNMQQQIGSSTQQDSIQQFCQNDQQLSSNTQTMSISNLQSNANTQQLMSNNTQQLLQDQQHRNVNSYQQFNFGESNILNPNVQQQIHVNVSTHNMNMGVISRNNQDINSAVQQFNQTPVTISQQTDVNQQLMIDVAQMKSPLNSPSKSNQQLNTPAHLSPGKGDDALQHSQNVFSNTQHNQDTIYGVASNQGTDIFNSSGNKVTSGQESNFEISSQVGGQTHSMVGHCGTVGFMADQNEHSVQTGNTNLKTDGQQVICTTPHGVTNEMFDPAKVPSPTNQLQNHDAGSVINTCQTSPVPVIPETLNTDQVGESEIRNYPTEALTFKIVPLDAHTTSVTEELYQCNSLNNLVKKPTGFQYGDNQQIQEDIPKIFPKEFAQIRNLCPDSNSSSQHVSRSASGQTSPSNLDSPHSFCREGDTGQCSPIQTVPSNTLGSGNGDFDSATLLSRLMSHFTSDSRSTSLSSVSSTHQSMDQDTSSQASLVAMSEQLKIMDPNSNSTSFPMPVMPGPDFENILSNFNEETIFSVDLPHKDQNVLNTPTSVSEMPSDTQPVSSSSFSFASHLGLTSFNPENISINTAESLAKEEPGTRSTSITNESDNRVFRKPNEPLRCKGRVGRVKKMREASLCQQFPASSKGYQLQIIEQPEDQHRARYKTEGSRGSVKDRSQQGYPAVKLVGVHQTVTLQVFVGNDAGKVKPHGFYQACKVCGKNSTPCVERDIEGTTVIELQMDPTTEMVAKIDCVGILKLRNADVEQRMGVAKAKKKSLKARLVFRVSFKGSDGNCQILQVASHPILCTQPIGCPEICKKSLSESSVEGGSELFIIGKNFMKGTKVIFQEIGENGANKWEAEGEIDTDYFQNTHLICTVPAYDNCEIGSPVTVQIVIRCSGKTSYPQPFSYHPKVKQECMETESCLPKSFLHKVAPAALQLNGLIPQKSSQGLFQLPVAVARDLLPEKKPMKMETNQDNPPACSNLFTSSSQPIVPLAETIIQPMCNGVTKPL